MNPRQNNKQVNRDDNPDSPPVESKPASLFNRIDEGGDDPTPSTSPAGLGGNPPSPPKGPIEVATGAPEPEPEPGPTPEPVDLDAVIRAKQAKIEPRPNLDPFDPTRLRLSPDYAASLGVKRVLTTIPVRKPSKESFVRTHPDESYRLSTYVLELKEDQEMYLVSRDLWDELSSEATVSPRLLITTVNRAGIATLWPIRLPGPDGKLDSWSRSAMEAADIARTRWVRVSASMSLGAYEVSVATASLVEPVWPDLSLGQILAIAFRDKVIDSLDHPVLRRLRGEV